MKRISVKWKLTFLYTLFMAILVSATLVILLSLSSQEILSSVKQQLTERVYDSYEDIEYDEGFLDVDSDFLSVENGIFLSAYDFDGKLLYGKIPAGFPTAPALENDKHHSLSADGVKWYAFDSMKSIGGYGDIYVRGILSVTDAEQNITVFIRLSLILLPVLVCLAAILGYWFIGKMLRPVETMICTVTDIQESEDLSKRIPTGKAQDEFYHLAECFNDMLIRIEHSFQREKQFTSDVSHELRTPITVILSHCDYLLEQEDLPETYRSELKIIQKRSANMAQMVSQLLLLSRADKNLYALNMEFLNISELTEMAAEEERMAAEYKHIQIETEIEADLSINADQTLLIRLWINLINNAIQYGREGGYIKVSLKKEGPDIVGSVKDNGVGMTQEELSHIWERFYQADVSRTSDSGGAGLGLPMVKWIVEAHGGQIQVDSVKDEGSQFIFHLPQ